MMQRSLITLLFFAILGLQSVAQPIEAPLYRGGYLPLQASAHQQDYKHHGALRNQLIYRPDSLLPRRQKDRTFGSGKWRIMFFPAIDISGILANPDKRPTGGVFGLGAGMGISWKKVLYAQFNSLTSRAQWQRFSQRQAVLSGVEAGGQPWHKNEQGILHFSDFNGYINVQPNKYIVLGLGQGRQFIGEGYRTFFLSDHAGNMGYAHITTTFWRIKYKVIYSALRDMRKTSSARYSDMERKFAVTHYLSWNVAKWLNLGLFESIIWRGSDSLVHRGFDLHYLNPVTFMRPVEYATGSSDNALLGGAINIKPARHTLIYSQLLLDEFLVSALRADVLHRLRPSDTTIQWGWWANKYAIQLGISQFGIGRFKWLGFQSEFNFCRPFTYSHSDPMSNYGHLNRSMAHPAGSNFKEWMLLAFYNGKRLFCEGGFTIQERGTDSPGVNSGNDIYASYRYRQGDYFHHIGQQQTAYITRMHLRANWLWIPYNHLRLFAECSLRRQHLDGTQTTDAFMEVGITSRMFSKE